MEPRQPVVCFAGDNFWFSNARDRLHLMRALHRRGHRILWVNSIGMNMPRVRRSGFLKRLGLRLRSWARWLGKDRPGFHVLTPIALPLFGNRRIEAMNDAWITAQVKLAYRILGIDRPVVFASIPSFAGVVERLPRSGLIYYYSDKYDAYRDISAKASIADMDRRLFAAADVVFCVSFRIHRGLAEARPDVYYTPHPVDFRHFNDSLNSDLSPPPDLEAIPRPRIGYFGSLTDSNDQEMIRHAAAAAPDLHFVLIGRVLGDFSRLQSLPNVHFLGFKKYEELPAYGGHFDVAFMSWIPTEWIRHSNPLKTKEYLSLGLPVVSMPIDELQREFSDVIYFAETGQQFLAGVRRALAEDSPELREKRIARVRGESWDARVEEMMVKLEEIVGRG